MFDHIPHRRNSREEDWFFWWFTHADPGPDVCQLGKPKIQVDHGCSQIQLPARRNVSEWFARVLTVAKFIKIDHGWDPPNPVLKTVRAF